jgi:hypothetical protein
MSLNLTYISGVYKIAVTETGEIDKVKSIALCLGYSVIDGGLQGSIEMIDSAGEYQGYYDPDAGIGAIWIDDDSEAHVNFNNLGGEKWIYSLQPDDKPVTVDKD